MYILWHDRPRATNTNIVMLVAELARSERVAATGKVRRVSVCFLGSIRQKETQPRMEVYGNVVFWEHYDIRLKFWTRALGTLARTHRVGQTGLTLEQIAALASKIALRVPLPKPGEVRRWRRANTYDPEIDEGATKPFGFARDQPNARMRSREDLGLEILEQLPAYRAQF